MERSAIQHLAKRGKSQRQIAEDLGHSRNTVARALREPVDQAPARRQRSSQVDPYEPQIEQWLKGGWTIVRMLEELRADPANPYTGGRSVFSEAVRRIRELDPRARVIILTTYDTDEEITRALRAGAKAYVLKDISADDLITCIHDVLAGKTYLAPAAAAKLAEGVTRVQLTPRELATLQLMADGKANKEIATALGISDRTVKTHLGHLFEKLGVTSRTEAIGVATRRGLVRLE